MGCSDQSLLSLKKRKREGGHGVIALSFPFFAIPTGCQGLSEEKTKRKPHHV